MKIALRAALAIGLACAAVTPSFAATTINSTGSGWCDAGNSCNNTNVNQISNSYAQQGSYHDWFAFTLPVGTISSATLSIWNTANAGPSSANGDFNVYASSGFSYAGLVAGAVLGTVSLAVANNGTDHYVNITLNSAGLAALNAAQGSTFVFGGTTSQTNGYFSGYNGGTPVSTLTFDSAVPEPATWAMMLMGFGAVGFALRSRKREAGVSFG